MPDKTCPICGQTKPTTDYYVSRGAVGNYCKPCSNAKTREYRRNNFEKVRQLNLSNYHNHPDKKQHNKDRYDKHRNVYLTRRAEYSASVNGRLRMLLDSAKRRAKLDCKEFSLTYEELCNKYTGKCELTGIDFDLRPATGSRFNPYSPSIDKIDATKGYTGDNVRIVLTCVNLALNQWGTEVLDRWVVEYVKKRLLDNN